MFRHRPHPSHLAVPKNFCRLPGGYGVVKIAVSGAADTSRYGLGVFETAKELGREIARHGAITVTGATTGFPLFAAMGAKDECGFSLGFSPASTEREHVETYGLPLEYMDIVVYTGFGYSGRDLLLIRSADAVIIGPGRIGTYNEFAVAFEDHRPIGVLTGPWETDNIIHEIIKSAHRPNSNVVFAQDPHVLVEKLVALVTKQREELNLVYQNPEVAKNPKDAEIL